MNDAIYPNDASKSALNTAALKGVLVSSGQSFIIKDVVICAEVLPWWRRLLIRARILKRPKLHRISLASHGDVHIENCVIHNGSSAERRSDPHPDNRAADRNRQRDE